MLLSTLLPALDVRAISGSTNREILGLTQDSREVMPGGLYVAVRGGRSDGHDFVPFLPQASAVVVERPVSAPAGVTVVEVASTREALAPLAAAFFDYPARQLAVIGVTGTNGKTTTTTLVDQALGALGFPSGRIGTLGTWLCGEPLPTALTTPEALALHRLFRDAIGLGVRALSMEVSSIGVVQRRVDSIPFHLGIFTSFGRDHLDFHGTMEAYLDAKLRLFSEHLRSAGGFPRALVVEDAPIARARLPEDTLFYGEGTRADLHIEALRQTADGLALTWRTPWGSAEGRSPMIGRYNAYNLTAALGALLSLGVPLADAAAALSAAPGAAGRLEAVPNRRGLAVRVDYAHTPDALEAALNALRAVTSGALWLVFGAGGDRDPGKRPQMGAVAARLADHAILTTDNPRSEDPAAIASEVAAGHPGALILLDREAAIAHALTHAKPGDAVLIAGKGHENYQEVRGVKHPFDDRTVAAKLLAGGDA